MTARKTPTKAAAKTAAAKTAAARKAPVEPPRPLQWNEERRGLFLETLAMTSNVAASEREAGMAPGSAYRERRRSREFEAAWGRALADGYSRLELVLLERALAGIAKRTTRTETGTIVEDYSDRLGMALLTAHRAAVTVLRGKAGVDAETAKQRLARKIADISRTLGQ